MIRLPKPMTLLREAGLAPKKRLGQTFLTDPRAVAKIVDSLELSGDELVVEVGPGPGILTVPIASKAKKIVALEKDRGIAALLREKILPQYAPDAVVLDADALEYDYSSLFHEWGKRFKLAGNIPYNISGRLLYDLASLREMFSLAVLMVQLEVAERITSDPGTKSYGTLSVLLRHFFEIEAVLTLSPGSFTPRPKVYSRVLAFRPKKSPSPALADEELFKEVVKAAFRHRRKTLRNALRSEDHPLFAGPLLDDALAIAEIDGGLRPEALPPESFARLANGFVKLSRDG